jgi:hypothetical protein
MARIYGEIVVEQMILTVEEAMSRVIDWWGDLPPSMKEAIDQFALRWGLQSIPSNSSRERSTPQFRTLIARKVSSMLLRWIARNFDEET